MKKITRRSRQCEMETPADGALNPLLRRIFENRNVRSSAELDYSLKKLHPPQQLKGIARATEILQDAITNGEFIIVVGDYDTDGATATAVALLGLRALGAARVDYIAPNRFEYGYGLSAQIAEVVLQSQPDLVITVDNGIASIAGVARLREAGVTVIITDHHLAGAELPDADAIVNPNQPGCDFPSKALAGVGVMFYVLLSLRGAMRDAGAFTDAKEPNLAELLDLVALGTVADMVPLDYNNRILVAQGVSRVRGGRCRAGVRALMEVAGKRCENLNEKDFGFIIGPRLNAAGRLEDISIGIECLLADDDARALENAARLDEINRERRALENEMQQRAVEIVAEIETRDDTQNGFCLFDRDWHQGVVGLVANRIRERVNQPVIAFASGGDGQLRGSARSVTGLHIRDLLETISTREPALIEKFGGHAMAAGLTIAERDYETFANAFTELVGAHFKTNPPSNDIFTDGALAVDDFTVGTAELMRTASPWGQHFPPPMFDGAFRVTAARVVGDRHLKMTVTPVGAGDGDGASDTQLDAIAFRFVEPGEDLPALDTVEIAYQLVVDEFRGREKLQLWVVHLESLSV